MQALFKGKTVKKNITMFAALLLVVITLNACKKESNIESETTGQFVYSGTTYKGSCQSVSPMYCSTGIDVGIVVDRTTHSDYFTIYDMPTQSSGTYTITNADSNYAKCQLYIVYSRSDDNGHSQSGTLTKTGEKSFTFSVAMKDIIHGATYTMTGSGNY